MTSKPQPNPLLADEAQREAPRGRGVRGQGISASPLEPSSRPPLPGHRTASPRRESMEIMEKGDRCHLGCCCCVVVVVVVCCTQGRSDESNGRKDVAVKVMVLKVVVLKTVVKVVAAKVVMA